MKTYIHLKHPDGVNKRITHITLKYARITSQRGEKEKLRQFNFVFVDAFYNSILKQMVLNV
jgi:hypothetical protein